MVGRRRRMRGKMGRRLVSWRSRCGERARGRTWTVITKLGRGGLHLVALEMLPQGGRVGVGLVAPSHIAVVRLVRGVDVHMLLPITGVGEPSVTSFHLAFKRFLSWNSKKQLGNSLVNLAHLNEDGLKGQFYLCKHILGLNDLSCWPEGPGVEYPAPLGRHFPHMWIMLYPGSHSTRPPHHLYLSYTPFHTFVDANCKPNYMHERIIFWENIMRFSLQQTSYSHGNIMKY